MIPARFSAAMAGPEAAGPIKTVAATNWSGYAVTKTHVAFKTVSATFFIPYMDCKAFPGNPISYSAHWVGLDGFSSKTVEQDGISADCVGTKATYDAWYEIYPHPEVAESMQIYAGNSITASVYYNAKNGKYQMTVHDNTNGHQFSVWRRCGAASCVRSSAEVISEAPFVNGTQALLADYQAAGFGNVSVVTSGGQAGGIRTRYWTTYKIIQAEVNGLLAVPTALAGGAFSNYWQAAG